MTILLLDFYIKIRRCIYWGILGVLIKKKSLNLISFILISSILRGMEI